jgi:ribonuclease Z
MQVLILGSNSATPAYGRFPTSQVVTIKEQNYLVDCGEGAQMRMQDFKVKRSRINHVFISHMHGDHYFGLIGFLNSLALNGRNKELHLYCPKELKAIIDIQLMWALPYEIIYHFLIEEETQILLDNSQVCVTAFPVAHSIPTHGFLFIEKERKRKLLPEELRKYEVPKYFYSRLSEGEDYTQKNGEVIKNEWVTTNGKKDKSYAYTADTAPHKKYEAIIKNVDLLYHESTYTELHLDKAIDRGHSTSRQAAEVALKAAVKQLIIGHFSSRYEDVSGMLVEAKSIFKETALALEGSVFEV